MKFQIATLALAAAFVAAALAAGEHRAGALLGALVSSGISVAETLAMGFSARRSAKPTQAALLVFTVAFLLRLVAVGVSIYAVHVAGWSTVAFVIAFFVPFFVLSVVEWGYLHSLRRLPGNARMTVASLVTLALGLTLGQVHGGHAEAEPTPHAAAQAEPAGAPEAAEHQAPGHEAAAGHEAGAGHGDAAPHGGGHDTSLGAVMMHHVVDGYVIEYPGACHGGFAWNCEWNLRETFGTALVFGSVDMTPTKHVIMMWLASALLLLVIFSAVARKSLVPKGLYNFIELLVAFVRNELATANIGKENADRFLPYLLTAFFFILFVNLFGLLPYAGTATANVNVTVSLALFTFFITQYAAIRQIGVGGYLAHLTGGVPKSLWPLWFIMVPVEILGLFTKPFALTVRLFANMVAGHFVILALLGLIFAISVWVAPVSIALALAIFMLELFVAFVQAYIFTMLSSLFIGAAFAGHGLDEEHMHVDDHGQAKPAEAHH